MKILSLVSLLTFLTQVCCQNLGCRECIRAKVIYNLVTEKNDFDGTSKNCGILMIGEDSGTIRKVEQMFELNGGIQCAMVKITQFGQNDSWPGGIGSTFSNLVVVANQEVVNITNFGKQLKNKSKSNTIIILFSEPNFIRNYSVSLINSRVIRIVPITNSFKVFLSCEGATTEQLIDIWSISREKFVLGASFKALQLSCLQILQNKTFKGGLTGIVPYNIRQKGFPGAYGDMYRILSEKFGFSLILNAEKGFGTFNETIGKYQNGLLGKIAQGTSDFATTFANHRKYQHLTFSHAVFDTQMVYVSNARKPVNKYTNVLDPFTSTVWNCLLVMLVIVTVGFMLMQETFTYLYQDYNMKLSNDEKSILHYLIMTVGIMLEKGVQPKGFFIKFLSFKTFLIVYVLCAFVVTASFKGKLLASLVRVDLEPRIDTSEDVVSNDRLCFVPRSGSLYSDLRQSPNSYIRSVMAETKRQDLFISFGEMNNATYVNSLGKNVILHHRAFGKAFGFETGREVVFNAHQVIVYKKDFIWKRHFDAVISNLHSMGIIQSFVVKNRRFLKIPKPNDPEESNLVVMKLKHILSPVILQLCGLTLALIAFCYEKCKIKCVKQAEEIA